MRKDGWSFFVATLALIIFASSRCVTGEFDPPVDDVGGDPVSSGGDASSDLGADPEFDAVDLNGELIFSYELDDSHRFDVDGAPLFDDQNQPLYSQFAVSMVQPNRTLLIAAADTLEAPRADILIIVVPGYDGRLGSFDFHPECSSFWDYCALAIFLRGAPFDILGDATQWLSAADEAYILDGGAMEIESFPIGPDPFQPVVGSFEARASRWSHDESTGESHQGQEGLELRQGRFDIPVVFSNEP